MQTTAHGKSHAGRLVTVGICMAIAATLLVAGSARAESLCSDSWIGAAEGLWSNAEGWSAGHTPSSTDVACIPAGHLVRATGTNEMAVVQGKGTVHVESGTFEVTSSLEVSELANLTISGGTVSGAATVAITESLIFSGGVLSGTGETILRAGALGALEGIMSTHTLVNEGTITMNSGQARVVNGAILENDGIFIDNSSFPMIGDETALIKNKGIVKKTEGVTSYVEVPIENTGEVRAANGTLVFRRGGSSSAAARWEAAPSAVIALSGGSPYTVNGSALAGHIEIIGVLAVENASASSARLTLGGTLELLAGTLTVQALTQAGLVIGPGNLTISEALTWDLGNEQGSGTTTVNGAAKAEFGAGETSYVLHQRKLVNYGEVVLAEHGQFRLSEGARYENYGRTRVKQMFPLLVNGGSEIPPGIYNFGRIEGESTEVGVEPITWNYGLLRGSLKYEHLREAGRHTRGCESENLAFPKREYATEEGVCAASGDLTETQTDLNIAGVGPGLLLTRTYNSQAAEAGIKGPFGYGWSTPYSTKLTIVETPPPEEEWEFEAYPPEPTIVNIEQENGSSVEFVEQAGGIWKGPEGTPDILTGSKATGFVLTTEEQSVYRFAGSTGRLESLTDRYGNAITMTYNGSGQLTAVTDGASRSLKFAYGAKGLVESVEDPMKRVIKYGYSEAGDLTSVSQPNEEAARWAFGYEGTHKLKEIVDGRSGKTTIAYISGKVKSKTDPMGRTTAFGYADTYTEAVNEATGARTVQYYTSQGEPAEIIHGFGTALATSESFTYDKAGDRTTATDGNGHTTRYEYDNAGDKTLEEDPEGHKRKWTYDTRHNIETETTPDGETTTYERDEHGNPLKIRRPAPKGETQATEYTYYAAGLVKTKKDPLGHETSYEYDTAGDRTTEIDPEGDKRTWGYNTDSEETSTISPRGYETGKTTKYTTTTTRNARGLATEVETPLKHITKYEYDGDGNRTKQTDPLGQVTKYKYDADNELEETEYPNKATTETEYDGAGQTVKRTDGNGHATKYNRNILEQIDETTDPLERTTTRTYDPDGHLRELANAAKQTTTDKYDGDGHLIEITYSDGKTPTVKYEYNGDGLRTSMADGTGTTSYEYDQLDRPIETKDGHGNIIKYGYDLANELTELTYPNGKAVTDAYDKAGRRKAVTDWEGNTTTFAYDSDSDNKTITFPSATGDKDTYAYDETDSMSEAKFAKSESMLASIEYTRNKDNQITKAKDIGLPGEESYAYGYDEDSRLTKGGILTYKYDAAGNATTIAGGAASYDAADEIEKLGTVSYAYNELGERTKRSPALAPNTAYVYNQAEDLTAATKTGSFEDTYEYNGDGLRASQTKSGTTTYDAWEAAGKLPLLLTDGSYSYIYGAGGIPVEQVSAGGSIVYLHHDAQGSTRVITGTTGAKEGGDTYDAYGSLVGSSGTATTRLGYDGQYTDADTGLIYLRARYFDPGTAQFTTVDPALGLTAMPYQYAGDEPLVGADPSGECRATASRIPGPYPPLATQGECEKKLMSGKKQFETVKRRLRDLKADVNKLPAAERVTHLNSLNEAARALEKTLKAFKSRGCETTLGVGVPAEVLELAQTRWRLEENVVVGPE